MSVTDEDSVTIKPYGLMADLHAHNWTAFSSIDEEGRNTRLMHLVHEIHRCCDETRRAGGKYVVIAGDVFHTRGSVEPSVFNTIQKCFEEEVTRGVTFKAIAGNHDLATLDSVELGSSVHMLQRPGFLAFHEPVSIGSTDSRFHPMTMVPWFHNVDRYLQEITERADMLGPEVGKYDLICHIGIDGTLDGVPARGVTPAVLKAKGFKRVFSGHYHHHKEFGDGVYSIGAPTHQTWSDTGTKAGFCVVYPDRVRWFASHAPSFITLTGEEDPEDIPMMVDGHFVRANIGEADRVKISQWRDELTSIGARGVIINSIPPSTEERREGVSVKSITSLTKSVMDYVEEREFGKEVAESCGRILSEIGL